ncbi:hypothetical protein CSUI_009411 [Cystoisospora suis]|uniref:Uncharacterized protein n=1 Tax=Cystoisospora suis TaxID=483139 RepID=A0A2C6KK34_9APIC|nr:hypothetical protein CSUI_009411 [Cystoisospora suis]
MKMLFLLFYSRPSSYRRKRKRKTSLVEGVYLHASPGVEISRQVLKKRRTEYKEPWKKRDAAKRQEEGKEKKRHDLQLSLADTEISL